MDGGTSKHLMSCLDVFPWPPSPWWIASLNPWHTTACDKRAQLLSFFFSLFSCLRIWFINPHREDERPWHEYIHCWPTKEHKEQIATASLWPSKGTQTKNKQRQAHHDPTREHKGWTNQPVHHNPAKEHKRWTNNCTLHSVPVEEHKGRTNSRYIYFCL